MTTEEKTKKAALNLFQEKGYDATRTREIADAAGVSTTSLNYYFRSKENLFNVVMYENLQQMFGGIFSIPNDKETALSQKTDLLVDYYSNIFIQNPTF